MCLLGTHKTIILFAACASTAAGALAADTTDKAAAGKALLELRCGRCHAIEKTGRSPIPNAPSLRAVFQQYPRERLEFELSEGVGSRHKDMPQIQFSSEQIEAILQYLIRPD